MIDRMDTTDSNSHLALWESYSALARQCLTLADDHLAAHLLEAEEDGDWFVVADVVDRIAGPEYAGLTVLKGYVQ